MIMFFALLGMAAFALGVIMFTGFLSENYGESGAEALIGLSVACFTVAFVFAYLIPTSFVYKDEIIIYYRPNEILRSQNYCNVTITFKKYEKPNFDGTDVFSKDICNKITTQTFNYNNNDKAKLFLAYPDKNILVRSVLGKTLYNTYLVATANIVCLTDKELEEITINENL